MANNRAAIRAAVKAMLISQTDAGTNIYSNRETSLWQSELPAILIYNNQEPAVPESIQARRYYRTMELTVEVKLEVSTVIDDEIDSLLGDIEDLITADPSLSGTVLSTIQTNTEIRIDAGAEKDIGVGILTFECKYIS